jgi:DNA-binding NarL/FixJ family response regulator
MTRDSPNGGGTADEGSNVRRSEIRVLVADDHEVVRDGLVAMLGKRTDVTVVAQAENGREAVEQWRHHRPDVTLLDLRMPRPRRR